MSNVCPTCTPCRAAPVWKVARCNRPTLLLWCCHAPDSYEKLQVSSGRTYSKPRTLSSGRKTQTMAKTSIVRPNVRNHFLSNDGPGQPFQTQRPREDHGGPRGHPCFAGAAPLSPCRNTSKAAWRMQGSMMCGQCLGPRARGRANSPDLQPGH